MQKNTTLISKIIFSRDDIARHLTILLKKNGFAHYQLKRIRFCKVLNLYLVDNKINLTYCLVDILLPEFVNRKLKSEKKKGVYCL